MSEKRYFKIEYDEEWYLFDSTTISEQLVKEQAEYGYGVFANSLSPSEIEGLLNEKESRINTLVKENEQLKEKLQSVTMLKDDYEELIESFEKKYGKNIEDVIDDE